MRDTRENPSANCAPRPITAEEIVNHIFSNAATVKIRETLHNMMLAIFINFPNIVDRIKYSVYSNYQELYDYLKKMKQLNPYMNQSNGIQQSENHLTTQI